MTYDTTGFQVMTMVEELSVNVGVLGFLLGFSGSVLRDIVTSLSDESNSITWWSSVSRATLFGSLLGTVGAIAGESALDL